MAVPGSTSGRLAALFSDIPDGTGFQVETHTDSLSVDAFAEQRPDLILEAAGIGARQSVESENGDDPSAASVNRRVELQHEG